MKTNITTSLRIPRIVMAALIGMLSFPGSSDAKPKYKDKSYSHSGSHHDRAWSDYHSVPRSRFTISLGTGYAGRGYYFGPPGVPYYYERPGVQFYQYHYQVPRPYYSEGYYGDVTAAAIQRALRQLGYYYGPIDAEIGPGTRNAIARYQADHQLPVTGFVDRALIYSMGLG